MHRLFFRFAFCLAASFCSLNLYAQQDPQFSQHFLNSFVYNPAFSGLDNSLSVTAHIRAQWLGIDGSPVVQNLSAHSPIEIFHSGAGIQVLNEQQGAIRNTVASLSYSYIIKTSAGKFSMGLNGGIIQTSLDGNKLKASDGNYTSGVNHNDPLLSVSTVSAISPDFGAGFFFKSSKLAIGLSAMHLFRPAIILDGDGSNLEINMVPQFYLHANYQIKMSKSIKINPIVYVKTNGSLLQPEADVVLTYNDFVWIGGGYRGYNNYTKDGVIVLAGMNISDRLRIGYSYDYTMSALSMVSNGSHEVLLNYRINLIKQAKQGKVIYNPRF